MTVYKYIFQAIVYAFESPLIFIKNVLYQKILNSGIFYTFIR